MKRRLTRITLGAAVFAIVLCIDDAGPFQPGFFSTANAVIGRPLTRVFGSSKARG